MFKALNLAILSAPTKKSLLLSIIKSSFDFIISFVGLNLIFFLIIVALNVKLFNSILSFVFIPHEERK